MRKCWTVDDTEFEALVREMNGEKTVAQIVKETSEAFARDLERIMRPAPSSHDFVLQDHSGIAVCRRCGRAQTTRTKITGCDGVDTVDWPDSTR